MYMMKKKEKKSIKDIINIISDNYLFELIFIVSNLLNGLILRIITVSNGLSISPLLMDLFYLIIVSLLSIIFKNKSKYKFLILVSIILNITCIINSIYYNYYSSFASYSMLATAIFAKDVGDAIVENVLKPIDLIYIWQSELIIISYFTLKK